MSYALSGPIVFVIDDQKAVRDALREMLSVFGFSVETYESADNFLAAMRNPQVGCIVADVRLPGTDGIALVRELARRKIGLPVVLISGHADVPMAVAGIKAGAEDFIEKPIDDARLVAAINRGLTRIFSEQNMQQSLAALSAQFARLTPRRRDFRPRCAGVHQPGDCRQARHQHAHGRELPHAGNGEDAGRERRRSRASGNSLRPHRPVEAPS